MNWQFSIAGILTVVVALVHSVLGERWIFNRMRRSNVIPTNGGAILRESHVRILWASWHVLSVLGLALAACLFLLAAVALPRPLVSFVGCAIAVSMFVSSALVFMATEAKHLGWLGLLLVSVFTIWGLLA